MSHDDATGQAPEEQTPMESDRPFELPTEVLPDDVDHDATSRLVALGLTRPQADVYLYLIGSTMAWGYQPSIRQVGKALGINSPNGIYSHLQPLAKKGWITLAEGKRRCMGFLRRPDGGPFLGFACRGDD